MKITDNKFIPYGRQNITDEDINSVIDVLKSDFLTQGPLVEVFESKVAKKLSSKYAIALNSATSALHVTCLALGLGLNDWLWTSPISFVASANCGLYCGAKIDFVDIDPLTGLMSIDALRIKLERAKKENKLPKIVIPVHLGGASCDMESIKTLSDQYGFHIVEDASHAIGGKYQNKYVGNCVYSSATIFSLHPVKIITTGEGGIVTCNDKDIAKKIKLLKSHGITKNKKDFIYKDAGPWSYEQHFLGFNYRFNEIQAALGISQLKRLDSIVKKRNILFENYVSLLRDLPVYFLKIPNDVYSSLHLAIIRFENKEKEYHLKIFNELRSRNIGVQVHYIPIHLHPIYRDFGFEEGNFPESEIYANNAISLPIYPELSFQSQERVSNAIKEIIK